MATHLYLRFMGSLKLRVRQALPLCHCFANRPLATLDQMPVVLAGSVFKSKLLSLAYLVAFKSVREDLNPYLWKGCLCTTLYLSLLLLNVWGLLSLTLLLFETWFRVS